MKDKIADKKAKELEKIVREYNCKVKIKKKVLKKERLRLEREAERKRKADFPKSFCKKQKSN